MLRASSDGVVIVDTGGLVRRFNDQAELLYGRARADVLGTPYADLIPEAEAERHAAFLRRVLDGEVVQHMESWHIRTDGSTAHVSLGGSPLAEDDGPVVGACVFVRDIDDVVRAREEAEATTAELRQSNAQLDRAFNSPLLPQAIYDGQARYLRVNDAFCELVGRSREWLLEHTVLDVTHPDDVDDILRGLRASTSGEPIPPRIEKRYLHADGHAIWVEINLSQHVSGDGGVEFIAHIRDISETLADKRELEARQRRLDASQEAGRVGTWEIDLGSGVPHWSLGQRRIHLLGPDEPLPSWEEFRAQVHPDDREGLGFPDRHEPHEVTYRWMRDPDNVRVIVDSSTWVPGEGDHPGYRVGIAQDITNERLAAEALRASEHRFRIAFNTSLVPTGVVDGSARILQINDAGCELFGHPREEVLGRTFEDYAHPDEREWLRALVAHMRSGSAQEGQTELRLVVAGGRLVWVEASMAVMQPASATHPGEYIVQLRDITEQRQNVEELRYLADHDPLTGVLNKRGFDQALETFVEQNQLGNRAALGALLLIDLDHFKHHNDTYGHPHGDQILVAIADTLRERLREEDAVARTGGDEFAVILSGITAEEADLVAADLVERLASAAAAISPDDENPVTVSIGIADFTGRPDFPTVIRQADAGLYAAKSAGRNQSKRLPSE